MMHVPLQPVSRENWRACARLELQPDQARFVAPNVYSLAQALTEPEDCPLVIYAGDTVVGFRLRALPDCDAIWLSVAPQNVAAERLYRSLGFVPTGALDDSGEPIFCLRLE
jgi:hypothetical protein